MREIHTEWGKSQRLSLDLSDYPQINDTLAEVSIYRLFPACKINTNMSREVSSFTLNIERVEEKQGRAFQLNTA